MDDTIAEQTTERAGVAARAADETQALELRVGRLPLTSSDRKIKG